MSEPGSCSFNSETSKSEGTASCCISAEGGISRDLSSEGEAYAGSVLSVPVSENSFRSVEVRSAAGRDAGSMRISKNVKNTGMLGPFSGSAHDRGALIREQGANSV